MSQLGPPTNGDSPPVVPPSPVLQTVQLAQVMGPGAQPMVLIVFHSPTGSSVHFLDGESAERIAKEMGRLAQLTKAGLSVPGR